MARGPVPAGRHGRVCMGSLSFHVPQPLPLGGKAALDLARVAAGYDLTPTPTRVKVSGNLLTLTRNQNESGYLTVPWPVPEIGYPLTASATLRERPEPYRLSVELARGKLNQVRTQTAEWQQAGLWFGADFMAELSAATRQFASAVVDTNAATADAAAAEVLARSYRLAGRAAEGYAGVSASVRREDPHDVPAALGCRLHAAPPRELERYFLETFTAARVVPNWSRVEAEESRYDWAELDAAVSWAASRGLPVSIGPVIDLSGGTTPPWLDEWKGDLPSIAAFLCDFVETAVHRYRDRVTDWLLFTGFNDRPVLGLAEDDRLRLAAKLLDAARGADPDGRWSVGVRRPFGDYLEDVAAAYSPLVFADTLLRTGLPVAGFELDLSAGSYLRDGLEVIRLFELFAVLGVPLDVVAGHPGRAGAGTGPAEAGPVPNGLWRGSDSAAAQDEWGGALAALALAVPPVRGFYWGRFCDDGDDVTGLIARDNRLKPLLDHFARLRFAAGG